MSHRSQQEEVDMNEPGVFVGPGSHSIARLVIKILVTRILRTVNVHFKSTFVTVVTTASMTQAFSDELLQRPGRPRARAAGPCPRAVPRPKPLWTPLQLPLFDVPISWLGPPSPFRDHWFWLFTLDYYRLNMFCVLFRFSQFADLI